mgnify:CR=1 FL=1
MITAENLEFNFKRFKKRLDKANKCMYLSSPGH